jgi:hypothetical protein
MLRFAAARVIHIYACVGVLVSLHVAKVGEYWFILLGMLRFEMFCKNAFDKTCYVGKLVKSRTKKLHTSFFALTWIFFSTG